MTLDYFLHIQQTRPDLSNFCWDCYPKNMQQHNTLAHDTWCTHRTA